VTRLTRDRRPRGSAAILAAPVLCLVGHPPLASASRLSAPYDGVFTYLHVEWLRIKDLVRRDRVPEYSHPGLRLPIFAPFGLD
jgi:hypothetical protein